MSIKTRLFSGSMQIYQRVSSLGVLWAFLSLIHWDIRIYPGCCSQEVIRVFLNGRSPLNHSGSLQGLRFLSYNTVFFHSSNALPPLASRKCVRVHGQSDAGKHDGGQVAFLSAHFFRCLCSASVCKAAGSGGRSKAAKLIPTLQ